MSEDTFFRRAANWMYGDSSYLQRTPPPELGDRHINELLSRHPFHPFDPEMSSEHPCSENNSLFYSCMTSDEVEGYELHMKHVTCYFPYKVNLMKCLSRERRLARVGASSDIDKQK
ncbi:uncharacterized protein TEOVI_000031700 [Trypanosoma equiperdum]|uniref:Uncharacterized protein n=1 Tax=Trypanosoma equiperdum TaxID=5694 RepID=A0A1G4I3U8_TRYEQ|nr:hypothetical protein, conserved [Trypanosoma equiperdum]